MNQQTFKSPMADGGDLSQPDAARDQNSSGEISIYLSNLNRLRDIYIDSSLFRNPAWEVFLSLYTKRQERLQVTLASLSTGNRLSEADCAEAIENLANAGLVRLNDGQTDKRPQSIDLTEQGQQRMAAFLSSAERGQA